VTGGTGGGLPQGGGGGVDLAGVFQKMTNKKAIVRSTSLTAAGPQSVEESDVKAQKKTSIAQYFTSSSKSEGAKEDPQRKEVVKSSQEIELQLRPTFQSRHPTTGSIELSGKSAIKQLAGRVRVRVTTTHLTSHSSIRILQWS
jgi:hypothetical protein